MTKDHLKFWSLVGVRTGVAACALGWLMLIFHWPYSSLVFTIGALLCVAAYALRTAFKDERSASDWTKLILVFCIFTRGMVGVNHWPFPEWLWLALGILVLASIVFIFFQDSSSLIPRAENNVVSRFLFSTAGSAIAIGVMFKIMHWPGAGPLLSVGTLSLVLWLVLEPFLGKRTISNYNTTNSFTTLDESLTEDVADGHITKKPSKNSPIFFLAGILMLLGLTMIFLNYPGGGLTVLAGFIFGSIYLFMSIRR
ncbi:MAG: hypothetical protein AB8B53_14745 [Flavobacteriales bacterium]